MKQILSGVAVIFTVLLIVISGLANYEAHKVNKFEQVQMNLLLALLQSEWGNPDKIIDYGNGSKTVFYYSILNEFVSNIDAKQQVSGKYKDNF